MSVFNNVCRFHIWKFFRTTKVAGVEFYLNAVAQMKFDLGSARVAFVVTSDDPEWCKHVLIPHLQEKVLDKADSRGEFGVFFAGQNGNKTPEHDLVLLSMCNHSIFSYGTFGLWSALLVGGRTIVYNVPVGELQEYLEEQTSTMECASQLPNWTAIM